MKVSSCPHKSPATCLKCGKLDNCMVVSETSKRHIKRMRKKNWYLTNVIEKKY